MLPVFHSNFSNKDSGALKESIKKFSFRKSKSNSSKSKAVKYKSLSEQSPSSLSMQSELCDKSNPIVPTLELGSVKQGFNEHRWAYENSGFYSLPVRACKKNKCSSTKAVITSDVFSQTKTLLYTDHKRSPKNFSSRFFDGKIAKSIPSNSTDSLNSSNDPEIVAALDQIASTMGLIDEKVSKTSQDPINYLLKTRSFSEKISIWKSSPHSQVHSGRVRSQIYHTEQNDRKYENRNQSVIPIPSISNSKESNASKKLRRFPQKEIRRTRSYSPVKMNLFPTINSKFSKDKKFTKTNEYIRLKVAAVVDKNISSELSDEADIPEPTNEIFNAKIKTFDLVNHCDQRLRNNGELQTSIGCQLNSTNARYINISISAFGYQPIHHVTPSQSLTTQESEYKTIDCNLNSDKLNPTREPY